MHTSDRAQNVSQRFFGRKARKGFRTFHFVVSPLTATNSIVAVPVEPHLYRMRGLFASEQTSGSSCTLNTPFLPRISLRWRVRRRSTGFDSPPRNTNSFCNNFRVYFLSWRSYCERLVVTWVIQESRRHLNNITIFNTSGFDVRPTEWMFWTFF